MSGPPCGVLQPAAPRGAMYTEHMELYLSQYLCIEPGVLDTYSAFDVSVTSDLPLFIDPFLLFHSDKPEYQALHEGILKYLRFLRDKAAGGQLDPQLVPPPTPSIHAPPPPSAWASRSFRLACHYLLGCRIFFSASANSPLMMRSAMSRASLSFSLHCPPSVATTLPFTVRCQAHLPSARVNRSRVAIRSPSSIACVSRTVVCQRLRTVARCGNAAARDLVAKPTGSTVDRWTSSPASTTTLSPLPIVWTSHHDLTMDEVSADRLGVKVQPLADPGE